MSCSKKSNNSQANELVAPSFACRQPLLILMKIEQRLGLNHRYLVRISCEGVDVQFSSSCLEVNVAERLQPTDFQLWVFDKHTAISRKALKVDMTLPIQIGTHLLDLKIRHIAYPPAQSALMSPWSPELKSLNQTPLRQHLTRCAYNLTEAHILDKHADNMCAACNPDKSLVLSALQLPLCINLEKLRVQRSLVK